MNNYIFSDIRLGMSHNFKVTVTEDMMAMFLKISSDCNPLHTDKEYAQERGFRDMVVYGMLTAAFYSTLVGVYLPGKHAILHGIDISFLKPVFVGDSLSVFGEIFYINEAYKRVEIKAKVTNQQGVKVSVAKIKVGLNE